MMSISEEKVGLVPVTNRNLWRQFPHLSRVKTLGTASRPKSPISRENASEQSISSHSASCTIQ